MKLNMVLMLSTVLFLSACGATGDIEIHDAWTRPAPNGENAAVYFTIHNHATDADELIGVSSNITEQAEIHESSLVNDVMQMQMLESLTIGVDQEIIFKPGGFHVMLVDIDREIKAGDRIGVILHFKNHEDIVVNASVGDAPGDGDEDDHQ